MSEKVVLGRGYDNRPEVTPEVTSERVLDLPQPKAKK